MATSMKYLSVNGKNGKTTANSIAVIAKCFAFSSVTDESLDVNFEIIDTCLLKLTRGRLSKLITCKPHEVMIIEPEVSQANVQLF